jgi:hypothetical protein
VALIVRYRAEDVTVVCTARAATVLTLAVGGVASRVEVDGRVVAARTDRSTLTGQRVTVDLTAGRHDLRIGIESRPSQPGEPATSEGAAR